MARDKTILIVDDQEINRQVIAELLTQPGYHLVLAGSGAEALEIVAEWKLDLILLDVMMPGMDGFEVCQRLKSNPQWQHIPIILVTALDRTEDLVQGFESGADDFIAKPFKRLELQARVRSMLRLKEHYDSLEAKNQQLEEMLQFREDMVKMLVHDMKNPLTSVNVYTELLLRDAEMSAQDRENLQAIKQGVNQLTKHTNDLLQRAKAEQTQDQA